MACIDTQQNHICVSNAGAGSAIHKIAVSEAFCGTATGKNVYGQQHSDDPYTTSPQSSHNEPQSFRCEIFILSMNPALVEGTAESGRQLQSGAERMADPVSISKSERE